MRWLLWRVADVVGLLVVVVLGGLLIADTAAFLREKRDASELAPSTGRFIATPSGRLFVQEDGASDGTPVVLVHGTAVWSEVWRPTMNVLAKAGYHAIAIDVPPFGFSDRPDTPRYTRFDQAERIIDLLDALKLDRAVVVAHSIGARGPMEALLRFPERFRGAVLVCGALGLRDDGDLPAPLPFLFAHPTLLHPLLAATATNPLITKLLFSRLLARTETATDDLVDMMQRPMPVRDSTRDFGRWLATVLAPDPDAWSLAPDRYRSVLTPLALIWGEQDAITPVAQAKDIASLVPNATLTIIPGVGHVPQVEDFTAFSAALLEALAKMRGTASARP